MAGKSIVRAGTELRTTLGHWPESGVKSARGWAADEPDQSRNALKGSCDERNNLVAENFGGKNGDLVGGATGCFKSAWNLLRVTQHSKILVLGFVASP